MSSALEDGDLSLRLPSDEGAPRLSRVFVSGVMETLSLDGRLVEDVRLVVSDLVTGLLASGDDIEVRIHVDGEAISIEGDIGGEPPPTVTLLGDLINIGRERWRIRLLRG